MDEIVVWLACLVILSCYLIKYLRELERLKQQKKDLDSAKERAYMLLRKNTEDKKTISVSVALPNWMTKMLEDGFSRWAAKYLDNYITEEYSREQFGASLEALSKKLGVLHEELLAAERRSRGNGDE